jgi:hypothetical protein
VLKETNTDTAPDPDGFPVVFFKYFWSLVKPLILQILDGFALGLIDISRLNFGILSLIPKVPGADDIKQFRTISLINVIFKLISKAYAIRLLPVVHCIISSSQTVFIKGRHIHDGALALHEIVHELRVKKTRAVILKLDFEKAYDRVTKDFLIHLKRIYNFLCSMLAYAPFALCFVTLRGVFLHFPELTY